MTEAETHDVHITFLGTPVCVAQEFGDIFDIYTAPIEVRSDLVGVLCAFTIPALSLQRMGRAFYVSETFVDPVECSTKEPVPVALGSYFPFVRAKFVGESRISIFNVLVRWGPWEQVSWK